MKPKSRRIAAKLAIGRCATPYCRGKQAPKDFRCSKCKMRRWRAKYPLKAAYSALRYRARRRGIEFALTLGQFEELCAKTGYLAGKGRSASCLHIDRIDPRQGYTWDNCQVITCSENSSKGNHERNHDHHEDECNEPF